MAWIIMEPEDTPPMSGSNSICVATVLLDSGIIPMVEPVTHMVLEAPGGLVHVRADCKNGKAQRVYVQNLPSFVDKMDVELTVPNLGTLRVDTAYGGDSFVIVDADKLGIDLVASEAKKLADIGMAITHAANQQLGVNHPTNPDWKHISFCLIAGALQDDADGLSARTAVAIRPGKIDRSPTGTAVSARMALLHAQGKMNVGDTFKGISIIDSEFTGRIVEATSVTDTPAIVPELSGRGRITVTQHLMLDADDPWPEGYRLGDTWPVMPS
jgi:proline racemase